MTRSDRRRARRGGIRGPVAALAVAGLAACAQIAPYQAPAFPFAAGWRGAPGASPVLLENARWWQRLNDPVFDALVARALSGNPSLDLARARVAAARAERGQVPAAASLRASAGVQREGASDEPTRTSGTADLGFDWLLDPWGGRRAELRAAGARIEAAEAEARAAQLLLLLNLGTAYVDLRYRQQLLALGRAEVRGRDRTLALTRSMEAAQSATRLEILRSEARVAAIRATLPALEADVAARQAEIAVLVGVSPGALPADLHADLHAALGRATPQPRPALPADIGIPADLLRNRPDIVAAEQRYYAALADVDAARAALYPRLSLGGTLSANALQRRGSGSTYFFGPSLQFPALPAGPARAAVEARHARAREAHAAWRIAVLDAILEVETALLDYRAQTAALRQAERAARLSREVVDLTREVFAARNATLGDLIDAEQALAEADRALADTRLRVAQGFVALNIRLGSGNAATAAADPAGTGTGTGANTSGGTD